MDADGLAYLRCAKAGVDGDFGLFPIGQINGYKTVGGIATGREFKSRHSAALIAKRFWRRQVGVLADNKQGTSDQKGGNAER